MDTSLRPEYVKEETLEDIERSEKFFIAFRTALVIFAILFMTVVGIAMYINPPVDENDIRASLYRTGAGVGNNTITNWSDPNCRIIGCPTTDDLK